MSRYQRVTIDLPEPLFKRVVAALDAEGLHVIEYVKGGAHRFEIATAPPVTAIARGEASTPESYVPRFLRGGALSSHYEFNR